MNGPQIGGSLAAAGRTPVAYNFANVIVSIGGYALSEYGAEGGITFERMAEQIEDRVSADGIVGLTRLNDPRQTATINLMTISAAYKHLFNLAKGQALAMDLGLPIVPLPFSFYDPATKRLLTSPHTIFKAIPPFVAEKTESEAEFTILIPYATVFEQVPDLTAAQQIASGQAVGTAPVGPAPVVP